MKKTDKLVITSANVFSRFNYSLIVPLTRNTSLVEIHSRSFSDKKLLSGPKQKSGRQRENKHNC